MCNPLGASSDRGRQEKVVLHMSIGESGGESMPGRARVPHDQRPSETRPMEHYMAEAYMPSTTDLTALEAEIRSATRTMRKEGARVRFLRSVLVPEDETCLLLFEANSAETVNELGRRASVTLTRVLETVEFGSPE